jgi:hypothetical protein
MSQAANVKQAMATIVQAHAIVADFHREVVAFFGIVDELLAAESSIIRLEPAPDNVQSVLMYGRNSLSQASDWCPTWLGRFYRSQAAHVDEQEPDVDPTTKAKLAGAFVWIASRPLEADLPGGAAPECVVGLYDPGTGGRAKNFWDGARYGAWSANFTAKLALGEWREGAFSDGTGKFGVGSYWCGTRILLEDMPDRDSIQGKLARPLLDRFAERFSA